MSEQKQFDSTNTGALFKNDKQGNATWADYRGSINVNGVEYWLSAWIKPTKKDPAVRFMSLSVKPKNEQAKQAPKPAGAAQGSGFDDMDNDIPFATSSMYYDMTTSKQRRMDRHGF